MNWFRVTIHRGAESLPIVGASKETLESLAQRLQNGQVIRLDQLLYINEANAVQEWEDWDHRVIPTMLINPQAILTIQQFSDDPREIPSPEDV